MANDNGDDGNGEDVGVDEPVERRVSAATQLWLERQILRHTVGLRKQIVLLDRTVAVLSKQVQLLSLIVLGACGITLTAILTTAVAFFVKR